MEEFKFDPVDGWEDVSEFPTTPADETATRTLFQKLYNQIRDFINTKIVAGHNAHLADYASSAAKTYYIDAANGNDNNDGLTAGTAFKTWAKTVGLIPVFINHQYKVKIIGNLSVDINLTGKYSHYGSDGLIIEGNTTTPSNQVLSGNLRVKMCSGVGGNGIIIRNLNLSGAVSVYSTTGLTIDNCEPRNAGGTAIFVESSLMQIQNCDFGTDVVQDAISISRCSTVFSNNNTGNATRYGLTAGHTSTLGKSGTQPTGTTTNENTYYGGVIR